MAESEGDTNTKRNSNNIKKYSKKKHYKKPQLKELTQG